MERKTTRFELRLPPELGDEIDGWRRTQQDIPSRAEAARRLIELGLEAARQKPGN
jgi:metal-responsive CopG/Arc/MetJ family transcriptional regulator